MRKVRDNSAGAPGGLWRWKHPETGYVITHSNFIGCKIAVKNFLRANNYPIGSNFEQEFEENLCENGHPNLCENFIPPSVLETMTELDRGLYARAKSGLKVRSSEMVIAIRDICRACPKFGGEAGFLQIACSQCGCTKKRLYIEGEHCPLPQPKW